MTKAYKSIDIVRMIWTVVSLTFNVFKIASDTLQKENADIRLPYFLVFNLIRVRRSMMLIKLHNIRSNIPGI